MALMCTKCGYRNAAGRMGGHCPACSTPYTAETARKAAASAYTPGDGKPRPLSPGLRRILMGVAGIVIFGAMVRCNDAANTRAAIRDGQRAQQAADQAAAQRRAIDDLVKAGKIVVGMSAEDARAAWGEPTTVNRTVGAAGASEQWVYRLYGGRANYVYIRGGVVSSYQISE
jgi:hypothetical protein